MTPADRPTARSRHKIALPPWLDRLSVRVAQWPWWALIIGVGLVFMFYSFLTSNFYREALNAETARFVLTTDEYSSVAYDVKNADGTVQRLSGILTAQDNSSVTIITQPETNVTLPQTDFTNFTCGKTTNVNACPIGSPVSLVRTRITGAFTSDDVGYYQLRTVDGEFRIHTFAVADKPKNQQQPADPLQPKLNKAATFVPPNCNADPEGACSVTLQLNPDYHQDPPQYDENPIKGILTENGSDHIVVQTQPRQTTTIQRSAIVKEVNNTPAQCALNNLAACTVGIWLTPWITLTAFSLALIIGLALGLMRVSSDSVLFNLATVYIELFRGIPLLVTILFMGFVVAPFLRSDPSLSVTLLSIAPTLKTAILVSIVLLGGYFVLQRLFQPSVLLDILRTLAILISFVMLVLGLVNVFQMRPHIDDLQAAILGLAFCYGAFLAELFRAGIQSIGRGQMEAARSLGMTYTQAMRYVILPQAFRVILPPLGNEFIAILKDSSLVTILAVAELTQEARLFAASSLRPFPVYVTLGVLYLCMTLFLSFVVRVIEQRSTISRR